jgi:hypothetical protein
MKDVIFEIVITVVIAVLFVFLFFAVAYGVFTLFGEDPASEYRALCIKNEGKPVFNGKYWECMK